MCVNVDVPQRHVAYVFVQVQKVVGVVLEAGGPINAHLHTHAQCITVISVSDVRTHTRAWLA